MEVEIHIKITKEQNDFLEQFKKDHQVNKQAFILKAIEDKIQQIKKHN